MGEGTKYMSLLLNAASMCRMERKREKMVQRIKTIDKRGVDIIGKLFVAVRKERKKKCSYRGQYTHN